MCISPEDEVVRICQELIRIDTSNFGDNVGPGERKAAEYTAGLIEEVGLSTQLFEAAPGRTSVVARMEGSDSSLPALVVHGRRDPFFPVGNGEALAREIPGARRLVLERAATAIPDAAAAEVAAAMLGL